jgi:transposase
LITILTISACNGLYQVSDQLLKKKATIEEHLYKRQRSLFGLLETITLYDLTNTYFEGQSKANAYAARGHSKEKRTDCPLVTFGLVLDSSGFPRRSHVYDGNVSEPTTLAEMLRDLEGGHVSTGLKPTVVMDAGIATEDNIAWLRQHQYPYLVVSRKRHREFDEESSVVVKKDDTSARSGCRKFLTKKPRRRCYTATPVNGRRKIRPLTTGSPADWKRLCTSWKVVCIRNDRSKNTTRSW